MCPRIRALFGPRLPFHLWGGKGVHALQEEMRRGETDEGLKREASGGDSSGWRKV